MPFMSLICVNQIFKNTYNDLFHALVREHFSYNLPSFYMCVTSTCNLKCFFHMITNWIRKLLHMNHVLHFSGRFVRCETLYRIHKYYVFAVYYYHRYFLHKYGNNNIVLSTTRRSIWQDNSCLVTEPEELQRLFKFDTFLDLNDPLLANRIVSKPLSPWWFSKVYFLYNFILSYGV